MAQLLTGSTTQFHPFLDTALEELATWRATATDQHSTGFYASVERSLRAMKAMSTIDELDTAVHSLTRVIADSGPLSNRFIPSFLAIANTLARSRRGT